MTGTWKIKSEVGKRPAEPGNQAAISPPGTREVMPPVQWQPLCNCEAPPGCSAWRGAGRCSPPKKCVSISMVIQRAWRLRTRWALFFQTAPLHLHKKTMFFPGHRCLVFRIYQSESSDSAPTAKLGSYFWGQEVPKRREGSSHPEGM